jgi:hypothetical protein
MFGGGRVSVGQRSRWRGGQDVGINSAAFSEESHQDSGCDREVVFVEHVDRVTDADGHEARVRVVGDHLYAIILTIEAHPAPHSRRLLWITVWRQHTRGTTGFAELRTLSPAAGGPAHLAPSQDMVPRCDHVGGSALSQAAARRADARDSHASWITSANS